MKYSIKVCYRLINSQRRKPTNAQRNRFFPSISTKKQAKAEYQCLAREKSIGKAVVLIISVLCMPRMVSIYFRQ